MTPDLLAMLTPEEREAWALCESCGPYADMGDDGTYAGEVRRCSDFALVHQDCDDDGARKFIAEASVALPLALTTIATLRRDLRDAAVDRIILRNERDEQAATVDRLSDSMVVLDGRARACSVDVAAEMERLRAELRAVADLIQEVGVLGIASTMDAVVVSGQPSARDLLTWAAKAMDAWPKERQTLRDRLVMAEEREREMVTARGIANAEIAELRATLANDRGEGEPPSEGWTWNGACDAWYLRKDVIVAAVERWTPSKELPYWTMATDADYGREVRYQSARAAMKAADDAVKGAT